LAECSEKGRAFSRHIRLFDLAFSTNFLQTISLQSRVLPIGLIQFILPTTDLLCRRTRHWGAAPPSPPLATPLEALYGASTSDLLVFYCAVIRSVLDTERKFGAVVYKTNAKEKHRKNSKPCPENNLSRPW
jgi:hypothetical protein